MKKLIILIIMLLSTSMISEKEARHAEVNFGFFYSSLNPYGEWIQIDYDLVVWKPYRVTHNWTPYSVGHWEYTNYGWYWESYEPFGWATYHYGRWYYDNYYGWVWVPGYRWAPAWVEWRYSGSHIGWAPLPPYAEFDIHVGIRFSLNFRTSYHHWHFVTYNQFHHRNVHHYFVHTRYKNEIFNNTKYRTNYRYSGGRIVNAGVDRRYVENRAGRRIDERAVTRTTDLRDYTNSRSRANDRIVAYKPDEREVAKFRNTDPVQIRKSDSRNSSLKRDIVTFRDRETSIGRNDAVNRNESSTRRDINNNDRIEVQKRNESNIPSRSTENYKRPSNNNERDVIQNRSTQNARSRPEIKTNTSVRKQNNNSYTAPKSSSRSTEIKRSNTSKRSEVKRSSGSRNEKSNNSSRSSSRKRSR